MESKDKVTVLGTPGGTRIITMVLLGILGYDDGLDAQQVAALPRYHHQWMPDVIEAETGAFTPEVVEGLRAMGHTVAVPGEDEGNSRRSSHVWGNLQTVAWDLTTHTVSGVTVPRQSDEHTSELQSIMRISYSVFCMYKKQKTTHENEQ